MEELSKLTGHDRYLTTAALLAATLAVALLVEWVMARLLPRLTRRTASELDDRLLAALRRPIRVTVLVAGLALATLEIDPTSLLERGTVPLTGITLNLLTTIAIVVWMVAGVRIAGMLLDSANGRTRYVEPRTLPLFRNVANIGIVAAAIYFAFVTWGIDVTAWLASAGILGIAIGFAAKDSLANFFAGIFILTDAPYQVGDWVVLGSGERGQVTHVGIRSTRLLTRDDIEITIPNAVIGNAKIVNESSGRWTKKRLRVAVGDLGRSGHGRGRYPAGTVRTTCTPGTPSSDAPRSRWRSCSASSSSPRHPTRR